MPATRGPRASQRERWINYYRSPDYIPSVSHKTALGTKPEFFKNKIVVIGGGPKTRRLEEGRDEFRNPHGTCFKDPFVPAVQIHATMLLNLLRGDWLKQLPSAGEWAVLLAAALVLGLGLTFFPPTTAVFVTAGACWASG